jgi:acetyl-CoA acetyltransferase
MPDAFICDDIRTAIGRYGGAIAPGHPPGMSGARIAGTAALEPQGTGGRCALATMSVGVGRGVAVLHDRA